MKIAVVHSQYSSSTPSGENVVVADQVDLLRRCGHEVLEVVRRTDDEKERRNYRLSVAGRLLTGVSGEPRESLERFQPDIVHLHNTFPNFGTNWLSDWRQRTVATLHNFRPVCAAATLERDGSECVECLNIPILPAVKHRCYRSSRLSTLPLAIATAPTIGSIRRIVTDSAGLVVLNSRTKSLIEPVASGPVFLRPNFSPSLDKRDPVRGWVYAGRLSREKGIIELIDALPLNVELDVYGDGPLRDQLLGKIAGRPLIRWRGLVDRTTWLTALPEYRGLLVPSLWAEGIPTVILEALSAGVPVGVSNRVALSRELVSSGAGVTFDLNEGSTSLHHALSILDHPGMRRAASEVHAQQYSEGSWAAEMQEIYSQILRGLTRG